MSKIDKTQAAFIVALFIGLGIVLVKLGCIDGQREAKLQIERDRLCELHGDLEHLKGVCNEHF